MSIVVAITLMPRKIRIRLNARDYACDSRESADAKRGMASFVLTFSSGGVPQIEKRWKPVVYLVARLLHRQHSNAGFGKWGLAYQCALAFDNAAMRLMNRPALSAD